MKCEYIYKSEVQNEGLILFFGGWGSSPELFEEYTPEPGYDFMLCYDYRTLSFEPTFFNNYRKIKVFAWSMGVWVATQVLGNEVKASGDKNVGKLAEGLTIEKCVAIGGTPFPIDNRRGIPVGVFDGTVEKMSLPVLYKFRRRMCGDQIEHFEKHLPHRTLEDLKEELSRLGNMIRKSESLENEQDIIRWEKEVQNFIVEKENQRNLWTEAIVGENDVVFPSVNQMRAWNELGVKVITVPSSHYDHFLFARLIGGETDPKK